MSGEKARDGSMDFLFEIGTEELPAAAARSAVEQAGLLAGQTLSRHHIAIDPGKIRIWVTPRRIAVLIDDLPQMQQTQEKIERGPVAAKAYDDNGKPTKAAIGFARAKGIDIGDLEVRDYQGQEFVFAVKVREGSPTLELLPEICTEILHGIKFPRSMRWDDGGLRFSRPIRWLVTKYGDATIEYEIDGVNSSDSSRGHRFLGEPAIAIKNPASYRQQLMDANVVVDQEERRDIVLQGLAVESGKQGSSFIDPAAELEEVIYLAEFPSVHAGSFGEEHLRLPARVLTTCMQSHQRYFPLTSEQGLLAAGFLYVMNADPACATEITEGNERVLEGRIEDAEFSFGKDLDAGIETMTAGLGNVVFHHKLGSLADKTARLEALARIFISLVGLTETDLKTTMAAARLAKADQVSIMVQEFADLEGYMGSVYANLEGFPGDVCAAIEEQYLPISAGGNLPETGPGAVLAIADKVDNIVGAFAVEEVPTGSRDPYGIRRAAAGLAAISAKFGYDFDIVTLLGSAYRLYLDQKADVSRDADITVSAREFVFDRIQHRLVEAGMPVEIVEAARAGGLNSTIRLESLAAALESFRFLPEFEDFHTAYFRCTKIAAKAGAGFEDNAIDESLFENDAERELLETINILEPEVRRLAESRDYEEALKSASRLRPVVDVFFDEVMVMADDEKIRNNRLALVIKAAKMLRQLGDPMRVAAVARDES